MTKFKVGDRVISPRGFKGTIVEVYCKDACAVLYDGSDEACNQYMSPLKLVESPKMTNDLITQAKNYLAKTKGITGHEWEYRPLKGFIVIDDNGINQDAPTNKDLEAMCLTPTARKLIEEFVARVEEYESKLKRLKEEVKENFAHEGFEAAYYSGLDFALSIMSEAGDETQLKS